MLQYVPCSSVLRLSAVTDAVTNAGRLDVRFARAEPCFRYLSLKHDMPVRSGQQEKRIFPKYLIKVPFQKKNPTQPKPLAQC